MEPMPKKSVAWNCTEFHELIVTPIWLYFLDKLVVDCPMDI